MIALIVLCLLALGFYMVSLDFSPFKMDLYWWHKSFGTLVFFLVLLRLLWRFISPRPGHIETHQKWERVLAKIIHALLYIGMIGMPLSGWLMSSAGDFPHTFFDLFDMPDAVGKNKVLFELTEEVHEICSYALMIAVGLHGIGAFKHHFIDKDMTLLRMTPKPSVTLIIILFVALMGSSSFFMVTHWLPKEHKHEHTASHIQAPAIESAAPRWDIIPDQSQIGFKAFVQGKEFKGQFTDFNGDIFFDPDNLAKSAADIRVKIASVQTEITARDQYLVMEPWLFAESFPESQLKTTKFEKVNKNQYVAYANLTMRGVSLPVTIPLTLAFSQNNGGHEVVSMQGSFEIKRLDFNIGTGDWSDPKMAENTVVIEVSLKAVHQEKTAR